MSSVHRLDRPYPRKRITADWGTLPPDLLLVICEKLHSSIDYVRIRSVCTGWRAAVPRIKFPPLLKLPSSHYYDFPIFDPFYRRVRYLSLPKSPRHIRLLGLSHGWIIAAYPNKKGKVAGFAGSIHLLNPLTRARLSLPPATMDLALDSEIYRTNAHQGEHRFSVGEVTLSCPPTSGDDCVVIAVIRESTALAVCRLGDQAWALLDTKLACEVMFVARCNGSFYAIDISGSVAMFEVGPPATAHRTWSLCLPHNRSVVAIFGLAKDLLVMARNFETDRDRSKHGYEVYKVKVDDDDREETKELIKVESIGDKTLFYTHLGKSKILQGEFSGCKRNVVYATNCHTSTPLPDGERDYFRVLDLKDGSSEVSSRNLAKLRDGCAWFTPCLC